MLRLKINMSLYLIMGEVCIYLDFIYSRVSGAEVLLKEVLPNSAGLTCA